VADPLETRSYPTSATIPNSVTLGQSVWAYVWVSKFWGRWALPPGPRTNPLETRYSPTVPNFIAVGYFEDAAAPPPGM